jgi:hypothetical protein
MKQYLVMALLTLGMIAMALNTGQIFVFADEDTITVGYGAVSDYYGKGKIVIKNLDTGKTLVNHDLNFAKQHRNQGDDCCVKVYRFDKSATHTHSGDKLSIKVTGGGGSWQGESWEYKKNLRVNMELDEIGESNDQ